MQTKGPIPGLFLLPFNMLDLRLAGAVPKRFKGTVLKTVSGGDLSQSSNLCCSAISNRIEPLQARRRLGLYLVPMEVGVQQIAAGFVSWFFATRMIEIVTS